MVDEATKKTLAAIPLLRTNAGPRDRDQWAERLKEEYLCLIKVQGENVMRFLVGWGLINWASDLVPSTHTFPRRAVCQQ